MDINKDDIEELLGYLFYDLAVANCLNQKGLDIVVNDSFIACPELKKELTDTVKMWLNALE